MICLAPESQMHNFFSQSEEVVFFDEKSYRFVLLTNHSLLVKKFLAIVILAVHLFNLGGYNLLYQYLIYKNDSNLHARLENVSDRDLLEIKIPLRLPYVTDRLDYEQIDVQMEVDGISYNVIKRKIVRDTLYLKYLPDLAKTSLNKSKTAFEKDIHQSPLDKKSESGNKKNTHSPEYTFQENLFFFSSGELQLKDTAHELIARIGNQSPEAPFTPPELLG